MRHRGSVALLALMMLGLSGCLGGLEHDAGAKGVAGAADRLWPIRRTSDEPHWLMRGVAGWRAAHTAGYGLLTDGPAIGAVHVILFDDEAHAAAAFARLDSDYLVRTFPDQIAFVPWDDPLATPLPADQSEVYSYVVAAYRGIPSPFHGRLVKLRQGRAVALLFAFGLDDDHLSNGAVAVARAAARLPARATGKE